MADAAAADNGSGAEFKAPGPGLAAILLVALGEQDAEQVLQYIEPEEVQSIGEAINAMPPISQTAIAGTLEKFAEDVQDQSSLGVGGGPFFQQLLVRALGREKAGSVLSRLDQHNKPVGVESLKWMPAKGIAKIVANEHPQVIAAVLSCLQRSHAGEVLQLLPEEIRADVVLRVVELDSLHPEALKELDEIITHSFNQDPGNLVTDVGGLMVGAEILNVVPGTIEERVLEEIEQLKPGMAGKIKEKMFVFDGLMAADDRGMQGLLREVTNDILLLALKGASDEMKEKIFKNMSKNAATLLKDDLEISGPVKLSEVEDAQREVLTVATKMAEDGRLVLAGAGDDYV
jgi:flagellar motor switch protein FliG